MIKIEDIRKLARHNICLYKAICMAKGRKLERKVGKEFAYYRRKANDLGLNYSEKNTIKLLRQRLAGRGLESRKKGDFHIFVVFGKVNWFENNLISELKKFGQVSIYNWFGKGFDDTGKNWVFENRRAMNQDLLKTIKAIHKKKRIDCFFGYVSNWNTMPNTIDAINKLGIFTVNISLDDIPSFWGKMKNGIWTGPAKLVSHIDLNWTSSRESCVKYLVEGGIPIFMPEGSNPELYETSSAGKDIDVSFIGRRYGWRPIIVDFLRKRGIQVQTFGWDWKEKEDISRQQMIDIWHRSKVNLGFGGIQHSQKLTCLKARDFEVPMARGFYLTQYNPELENFYEIGKEIVCYRNMEELVEKIHYFLAHSEQRESIAQMGWKRAISDHTWERRFEKIFRLAGLFH